MKTIWHGEARRWAAILACAGGLGLAAGPAAAETCPDWPEPDGAYERPYGPRAPWNVPVAELPRHPQSETFAERLWNHAPSSRPGNVNLVFEGYTYPVYDAREATLELPIYTEAVSPLDRTTMPWNPAWEPADSSDGQVIVIDPETGREWNLWKAWAGDDLIHAANGSLVPGDYRTREVGHPSSRGAGIPYLAMLVRPQEVAAGRIAHALSMPIRNPDGKTFVAPATKLEREHDAENTIPEGMRFALDVSDDAITKWIERLPRSLPCETRQAARIIAEALRDYGWFITDTAGGATLQFEDRTSADELWDDLGLGTYRIGLKEYPRDLLDGLLRRQRIYAIVPSDAYPEELRARETGAGR